VLETGCHLHLYTRTFERITSSVSDAVVKDEFPVGLLFIVVSVLCLLSVLLEHVIILELPVVSGSSSMASACAGSLALLDAGTHCS